MIYVKFKANILFGKKRSRLCAGGSLSLACILFISCLPGCTRSKNQPPDIHSRPSQELYLKSQRELVKGNYRRAYYDYKRAVSIEPGVANMNYLSNILYTWVISQSDAEDIPLLNAQKQVWLNPQQLAPRRELLSIAVDNDKSIIHAFGLGVAPKNISRPAQKRLLARQAALTDSYAWVARLAIWSSTGVEGPLDVSRRSVGVETLKESWVEELICVVEVKAPLNKNQP